MRANQLYREALGESSAAAFDRTEMINERFRDTSIWAEPVYLLRSERSKRNRNTESFHVLSNKTLEFFTRDLQ